MIFDFVLGLDQEEAFKMLNAQKINYRVKSIDGKPFILTGDVRSDRLNLVIKNNKVIEASIG